MARGPFATATDEYLEWSGGALCGNPCDEITMACWFRADSTTSVQRLMYYGDSATGNRFSRLNAVSDGTLEFQSRWTSARNAITTATYSANTWHHAAGVNTALDSHHVYLDGGNKVTQSTSHGATAGTTIVQSVGAMRDSTPQYSQGDVDICEFALWNVGLSDEEIAILGQGYSPLFIRPASLVLYRPLIRGDGGRVTSFATTTGGTVGVVDHPRIIYPSPSHTIFAPSAAGGSHNIAVQSALHSHTADSPAITQTHVIVVAEALHAHIADSPTITQTHVVVVAEALHSHTADLATVTQVIPIAVDEALHGHTADSPAITQTHVIVTDESLHAHTADSPAITQTHAIVAQEAIHAHSADNVTVTVGATVNIAVQEALHGHTADSPAITQTHTIVVAEALHSHIADSPAITQTHVIAVAEALHSHTADNVTVTIGGLPTFDFLQMQDVTARAGDIKDIQGRQSSVKNIKVQNG